MRIYQKVKETTERNKLVEKTCDLCGLKANENGDWDSSSFSVNEVEVEVKVRQKDGSAYPEGGWGTELIVDICPKCFKETLIPFLREKGAKIEERECPRCDGETEKVKSGAQLITLERLRQTKIEGWTPEHDDKHDNEELIQAAACYMAASADFVTNLEHIIWPWPDGWKPDTKIRNLTKAGALLAAEIDRLQRVASVQNVCMSHGGHP